jgi:hypothetical protein
MEDFINKAVKHELKTLIDITKKIDKFMLWLLKNHPEIIEEYLRVK